VNISAGSQEANKGVRVRKRVWIWLRVGGRVVIRGRREKRRQKEGKCASAYRL